MNVLYSFSNSPPISALMNYSCTGLFTPTKSNFFVQISTCHNTTKPLVGYLLAPSAFGNFNISDVASMQFLQSTYPAVLFRGASNFYSYQCASNSNGSQWKNGSTTFSADSSSPSGCLLLVNSVINLPTAIYIKNSSTITFVQSTADNFFYISTTTFDINTAAQSLYQNLVGPLTGFMNSGLANWLVLTSDSNSPVYTYANVPSPISPSLSFGSYSLSSISTATTGGLALLNISGIQTPAVVCGTSSSLTFLLSKVSNPTSSAQWNNAISISTTLFPLTGTTVQVLNITGISGMLLPIIIFTTGTSIFCSVAQNNAGTSWTGVNTLLDSDACQTNFQAVTLPSGKVGVIYIATSTFYARFAVISYSSGSVSVTSSPLGANYGCANFAGTSVLGGSTCVTFGTAATPLFLMGSSGNEGLVDSVNFSYNATGSYY